MATSKKSDTPAKASSSKSTTKTTRSSTARKDTAAKAEPQQQAQSPQTVTVEGTTYDINDLNERANQQVVNVRLADQEIERLQQRLSMARTARNAYYTALVEELKGVETPKH